VFGCYGGISRLDDVARASGNPDRPRREATVNQDGAGALSHAESTHTPLLCSANSFREQFKHYINPGHSESQCNTFGRCLFLEPRVGR
jgi:hypothetical protein